MKFYLIAAVFGCALISFAACNVVTETEHSLIQLEEAPQNVSQQVFIAAEPLSVASSQQLQKIVSQMPERIDESVDAHLKSDETVETINSSLDAVANPQEASLQNNREPKQLIGFIPTYMLHQAMRSAYNDVDDYDASDEIAEERAIRRRKRVRRRNTMGHIKQTRRHKNTNNSKQKKRRNSKRKSQNRHSSLRKKKSPRTKNKKIKTKAKPTEDN